MSKWYTIMKEHHNLRAYYSTILRDDYRWIRLADQIPNNGVNLLIVDVRDYNIESYNLLENLI
jgi:hypothetical protein